MANQCVSDSVNAEIQYLATDRRFQLEKPYYLYLTYDFEIPRTNTKTDRRLVRIDNARNLSVLPDKMFLEWGFTQLRFDSTLLPEDYYDTKKVKDILYPKYISTVRSLFPSAAQIEILEHAVRKRDPRWLADGGERHEIQTNQPSDYVHIDMTASSAEKCNIKKFQTLAKKYKRFVVVNLWKPIKGPVYDYPLTLCDRRTVDYASQTTAMDVVASTYVNENTRLYYNSNHRWYYWHALQENEAIIFVQADSEAEDRAGVPHTAFVDPRVEHNSQLRESIEARIYVYFDQSA